MSKTVVSGRNTNPNNQNKNTIVKDENGYYKVNLGAVNTYNDNGVFYKVEDINYHTSEKSVVGSRIRAGILRAEYDHPNFDNLTQKELINKILTINPDRICGHIKSVEFTNLGRSEIGWDKYPIHTVDAWFKPQGPFGEHLEESLSNPDENVALSIRSMVTEAKLGNTLVRNVLEISTWDFVVENGVKIATQWNAAGVERKQHIDGVVCLDGNCLPKLKSAVAGFENSENIQKLIDNMNKKKNISSKILNW